jgi:hypothetical protein
MTDETGSFLSHAKTAKEAEFPTQTTLSLK